MVNNDHGNRVTRYCLTGVIIRLTTRCATASATIEHGRNHCSAVHRSKKASCTMQQPFSRRSAPNPSVPAEQPWQRTLYASWFAQFVSTAGFAFVMPFLPFYIRELGDIPERQLPLWSGIAYSLAPLMLCVMSPIWGGVADKYGRKLMVQRAMFGAALVLLLMSSVKTVSGLLALRLLQGVLSGVAVASTTLVSSVTPRNRLGYSLGLLQMALLMGAFLGPWIGGTLAAQWGYRIPFVAASAALVSGGIVVHFFVQENFTPPQQCRNGNHGMRQAFGGRGLLALLSVFFFLTFSSQFVVPIFPLFVEGLHHTLPIAGDRQVARIVGLLSGITGLASGISTVLIGRLSDRIGHRRTLIGCALLSGIMSIPHAIVTGVSQLFGLRIGYGLASGGINPSINAIIGNSVSSDTYGRSYGMTQSAAALGLTLGPLAGGIATTVFGLRWPFVIMGVSLLVSAALVTACVRPRPMPQTIDADPAE